MLVRAWAVAACIVLPLFAPEVWTGFRVALSDPVLAEIAPVEQPLSVRSPSGVWAVVLALTWFRLAYWQRRVAWWEVALVLLGSVAVLARVGNAWLYGLAMVPPMARRLALVRSQWLFAGAAVGVGITAIVLAVTRPPSLPLDAQRAVVSASGSATVFADWRWSNALVRQVGTARRVLAADGLGSESPEFWLDYVRITRGHEHWAALLQRMGVDVVVLDTADQDRSAANLVRQAADWRILFDADGALVAARASR